MSYEYGFAGVYDKFTDPVVFNERASFILSALHRFGIPDGIVLDLACGTGRLSEILINAGYDVISVDNAPDMLSHARNRLAVFGDKALLLFQDMRELDLYGTVRATVCCMDSINHLITPENVKRVFERVALFTEPGGVFLFDVNTVYKHKLVLGNHTFVYEDASDFLVWQNEYDDKTHTVNMYLDLFSETPDGTYIRSSDEITERAYEPDLLKRMLEEAGFKEVYMFTDCSFAPPKETDERICFAAIR